MNYPFSVHSWDVLSGDVALKHMDRSTFLHHGTRVPRELSSFFRLPGDGLTEPRQVRLVLGDGVYDAHISMDAMDARYRLLWKTDFAEQLIDRFPYVYRKYALNEAYDEERPVMRFEHNSQDSFRIDLFETAAAIRPEAMDWTEQELEAAVYAYFTMLGRELRGRKYSRTEVIRQLRGLELINRDRGSVEFSMQNISSVLQDLCHPIVQGFPARMHASPEVSAQIRRIIFNRKFLMERDYTPTADQAELGRRAGSLLAKGIAGTPGGRRCPAVIAVTLTTYERDPLVAAWVLNHARGTCERCGMPGPFRNPSGEEFLEIHHVIPLAEGGPDTVANTVALCPNCHRICHLSPEADKVRQELMNRIDRID